MQGITAHKSFSQFEQLQDQYGLQKIVRLNANENPLGPSPWVLSELLKVLSKVNRYPDSSSHPLKEKLSEKFKVLSEQIVLGNGSNEIIDLLIRAYCGPGDHILTSKGAFLAYRLCAAIHGISCQETPITADYKFDLEALEQECRKDSSIKLVFIANPNNPTGTLLVAKEVEDFLVKISSLQDRSVIVVLDCAYWEYLPMEGKDPISLVERFPNLIVLKTFSKIYGLAGLRVGYGISSKELIVPLEKVRQPFNTNSVGQVAALLALEDQIYVQAATRANQTALAYWRSELEKLNLTLIPSSGNFFLANFSSHPLSTEQIYQNCLQRGLILQPVANYGFADFLRITTGTQEENEFAVSILKQII